MKESMLDTAYQIVRESKQPITFEDMVALIGKRLNLGEEELAKRVSQLYTNLLRDGRFVTIGENTWDLRVKHTFDMVHIDMNDIYVLEDEDVEDKSKDDIEIDIIDEIDDGVLGDEELDGFTIKSIDDDDDKEIE